MSLYKRGDVYWARFGIRGCDIRESLHTSDWQQAKMKERELLAKALKGRVRPAKDASFGRLPFHLDRPCAKCRADLGAEPGPLCRKCLLAGHSAGHGQPPAFGALELYRRDRKPELAATTVRLSLIHISDWRASGIDLSPGEKTFPGALLLKKPS